MYNQTNQRQLNDFELQISLENAFEQLEADDQPQLCKCLKLIIWLAQYKSIQQVAVKIDKNYNETKTILCECKQKLIEYQPIKNTNILSCEDLIWIDLLMDKSVPDADPEIIRETQIFRVALLSYSDKPKDSDEIPYPHILEQVLARLEAEKPIKNSWFNKLLDNGLDVRFEKM